MDRIGRGGSQNILAAALAAGLGILISIVVARSFSEADTGLYFAATSVALLVATVARLGTSIGLVYWVARLRHLGRTGEIGPLIRMALTPVMVLSVVLAIVMYVAADPLSRLLLDGGSTGASLLRVLALLLPAVVALDSLLAATRGYGTMTPTSVVDRIGRPAAQLILTLAAVALGGIIAVTVAWALPYALLCLIALMWLSRQLEQSAETADISGADAGPDDGPDPRLRAEFWQFSWPRAITSVVQQARQRFDIVLVSAMRGPAEAALYAIGTRFLVVGQLTNSALALAAQPQVATLATAERRDAINSVYRSTTTWIILLNGPLYVGVAIFSPLLLSLFGENYVDAWPVTVTLCLAGFLGNGSGMVDVMLSMTGRTGVTLANSLGALLTQVVLLFALVPEWGAFGAAVAWGVSIVVINAMSVYQLARADGIHPFESGTWYATAANIIGVAIPAGVVALWLGQTWAGFFVAVGLSVFAYGAVTWWFRDQIHLADLRRALLKRTG